MNGALTLVETREGCSVYGTKPRYNVLLDGQKVGQLYFHMRGYCGCYLPQPSGIPLLVGERSIGVYRRIVAELNRQWATARRSPMP